MPTGYTSDVTDTTTLAEFAMKCARAFGALVMMRDDPADAPIPEEFKPSDHHVEALRKAEARLLELRGMTADQADVLAAADYKAAVGRWEAQRKKDAALRERYERLRALCRAWEPPTPDHVGLRDFMVEQLTSSIDFDCTDYPAPVAKSGATWLAEQVKSEEWSENYHRTEGQKEIDRARSRTEWVKQLRASLQARP